MRWLLPVVVLCAAYVVAAVAVDAWGARRRVGGRYDVIVVLGCAVRADGRPSGALRRRAVEAVRLWRDGVAPRIAFAGGPSGERRAEASVASALAREMDVPSDAIVVEDRSTSTEENARELAALIGRRRVLVVTDSYHAWRSLRVFRRYFPDCDAIGLRPPPLGRARMALREVFVIALYAARGRL